MSEVLEATVIEPTGLEIAYTPAIINDNLDAIIAYVDEIVAPYIGWEIDIQDYTKVKQAKDSIATLNKIKKSVEDERKRIKNEYNAPLKAFEERIKKEITSKLDKAYRDVKNQIDEADQMFKDWRYSVLEEEYIACAGAVADVITFDAILDPKWLNRSTQEAKALKELEDKMEQALAGYKTLQTKELKHKDEVIKHYAETLDLIEALQVEDKLNERDRELAEFKARQAELESMTEPTPEPITESMGEPEILRYSLSMEFTGTRGFAQEVASTLKSLGITGATLKCLGVSND